MKTPIMTPIMALAKSRIRRAARWCAPLPMAAVAVFWLAMPVLAQEGNQPDPSDTPTGVAFRWINFAIVFGLIVYGFYKLGPTFLEQAMEISRKIQETAEAHAAAQRELDEAGRLLAQLPAEIEEMKRSAAQESAAEAERIGVLARSDADKIAAASQAEIGAAERAGRQEMRAIAARLATERAEALLRQRLNAQSQAMLFRVFVAQLPRVSQ